MLPKPSPNKPGPLVPETQEIRGRVEFVRHHNDGNGFTVMDVLGPERERICVVAFINSIQRGDHVACRGTFVDSPKFGRQFKAQHAQIIVPEQGNALEEYLANGAIPGIGAVLAKRLVKRFGSSLPKTIEETPEKLAQVRGISISKANEIHLAWMKHKRAIGEIREMASLGLPADVAVAIQKQVEGSAVEILKTNPYSLIGKVRAMTFTLADMVGSKVGIVQDDPRRVSAGMHAVLVDAGMSGHTYMEDDAFLKACSKFLQIDPSDVRKNIIAAMATNNVVRHEWADLGVQKDGYLYAAREIHHAERNAAANIKRLLANRGNAVMDARKAIESLNKQERLAGIKLDSSQRRAAENVLTHKLSIITGGPGVGKTTITRLIVSALVDEGHKVVLCSPTGRAAKRLAEATDMPAATIHRTLKYDPAFDEFTHCFVNPLEADVVIVDEASMIPVTLMSALVDALDDHASLILIGDADQLPSVGAGNAFADLIESGKIHVEKLQHVHRQAADSFIILNAQAINKGDMPIIKPNNPACLSDFHLCTFSSPQKIHQVALDLYMNRIPARFGFQPGKDIQIITPTNKGINGVHAFNEDLQQRLNPKTCDNSPAGWNRKFRKGDKVIQTANNYELEVFNGDIGHVVAVHPKNGSMTVDFDGMEVTYDRSSIRDLQLAYAITIHKSQGSEYPATIVVMDNETPIMHMRNLLYTAATRGSKLVVIVGHPEAIRRAVTNAHVSPRNTLLQHMLGRKDVTRNDAGLIELLTRTA